MAEPLSPTQKFILHTAADTRDGVVVFGKPDRRGTRKAGESATGHPIIIAYQTPEFFLKSRGLMELHGNERFTYRITDAGRAAIAKARATFDSQERANG